MDYHCDLICLHRHQPQRYPFLLQSAAHGAAQARYDILFAFPQSTLQLTAQGVVRDGTIDYRAADFLDAFDAEWSGANARPANSSAPFRGGWFVYLGYELAARIEPRLHGIPESPAGPIASAVRIPAAVIRDHQRKTIEIVAEPGFEHVRATIADDLASCTTQPIESSDALCREPGEDDPAAFLRSVELIKEYIRAGDVFQVNLSRRGWCDLARRTSNSELFARLCRANPGPFAALAVLGDMAIVSSSPERLVCVRDGIIETRPIAGTRPRGASELRDGELRDELIGHPKERAEHVMLVDLERNDLGRVCVHGTVRVDEFMTVESYAHVHHIVSNVRGRLRPAVTPGRIVRAVFPGGTITGCPKVRCMEIIAELEGVARGPYTGALGYINHDGSMDLNILIRTLVREGQHIRWHVGAGIVADSDPERELAETRDKARGLLRALGVSA
jgi:anthranilate synthase component 1